jgi:hypothetical protein
MFVVTLSLTLFHNREREVGFSLPFPPEVDPPVVGLEERKGSMKQSIGM